MKVAVEGIDGAGKTTISRILASKYNIEYIKFPRYEFIPMIKRHLTGEIVLEDRVTVLLFLADILDGINNKTKYIADRLFFSTIAYSKMDIDMLINTIEIFNIDFPDYVIYLDIDLNTAISRIAKKWDISVYDKNKELLERVKTRYEWLFDNHKIKSKTNVLWIDARKDLESVLLDIYKSIKF